jgi:hypothetical protein
MFFYICRDRFAPLQSLAHEPKAASPKGSPWLRAPIELELHGGGFRGSPCCHRPTTRFRVLLWATSIPCALTGSNFRWTGSGVPAPVELDLCKTLFRGSPCRLESTTRCACNLGRQSLAHEPGAASLGEFWCAAPPMAWNFARPDSGAHRGRNKRATLGANPMRGAHLPLRMRLFTRRDRMGSFAVQNSGVQTLIRPAKTP